LSLHFSADLQPVSRLTAPPCPDYYYYSRV